MPEPQPPRTPDELEDAICARLQAAFPSALVEPYPDRHEDFTKRPLKKPLAFLVGHQGTAYGPPQALGLLRASAIHTFEVQVLGKTRRGPSGAASQLAPLVKCLGGWRPHPLGDQLRPVSTEVLGVASDRWAYLATFQLPTTWLEHLVEPDPPLVSTLTISGPGGPSEVPLAP